MFRYICLATVLVCCVVGAPRAAKRPRYPPGSRIVGGEEVSIEEVPYQLEFEELFSHVCGASIISADWAVTAGHCASGSLEIFVKLRSGTSLRGEGGVLHDVDEIIVHEQYNSFDIDFDIALIKVAVPFEMSATTAPIVLASTAPVAGTASFVSGWGTTSSGGILLPKNLRGVEVPIVDQEACNTAYAQYGGVTDQMICAGLEEGGKDSCQGDSGGPLAAGGELVGIVSWGLGCAEAGYPGVYSNVAALRSWVLENSGV